MEELIFTIACIAVLTATALLYFFIIQPAQDAKNRAKAEKDQRDEIERIFDEAPTSFYRSNRKSA